MNRRRFLAAITGTLAALCGRKAKPQWITKLDNRVREHNVHYGNRCGKTLHFKSDIVTGRMNRNNDILGSGCVLTPIAIRHENGSPRIRG